LAEVTSTCRQASIDATRCNVAMSSVSCPECGYGLWAEEVPVAGRFGVWVCFDDEEQSDTYAEHVERCPGCGTWLNVKVLLAMRKRMRLR
jgi:hypothetical protein